MASTSACKKKRQQKTPSVVNPSPESPRRSLRTTSDGHHGDGTAQDRNSCVPLAERRAERHHGACWLCVLICGKQSQSLDSHARDTVFSPHTPAAQPESKILWVAILDPESQVLVT